MQSTNNVNIYFSYMTVWGLRYCKPMTLVLILDLDIVKCICLKGCKAVQNVIALTDMTENITYAHMRRVTIFLTEMQITPLVFLQL